MARLRAAFAHHKDALASSDTCWLGREGGGRTAFSGTLPPALEPGARLGDFEIVAELGRGGMGVVYRARQLSLGREVALKILPAYARHGPAAIQRFRVEAEAAARVHHTNIVSVYAQGEFDGQFYYAMELIEGVSLAHVIQAQPELLSTTHVCGASSAGWALDAPTRAGSPEPALRPVPAWALADLRRVAGLLAEVADGLDCAHRQGVIHRDVKPHNLLLGRDQRLHLTDFGLARLVDEPHLTISGEVMGTPAYLAPEQVRCGDEVDARADVYALGVTLYELLTGRKPFDGETREQVLHAICNAEPLSPRRVNPTVPVTLETICLRAIEKEPPRRHATAGLLAEDLRRFAAGRPILSRRASWWTKGVHWARRHRMLSAGVAAGVALLALCAGLAGSAHVAQRREGARLLSEAYAQLAYNDYRDPQRVAADVDRAAASGVDRIDLHRVRALLCLGALDQAGAAEHLAAVLAARPGDLAARYMLAWAQWRERDYAAAQATFAAAEERGPPATADAWFFRGLAVHYADPAMAIESYRQANALRAAAHGFYPQAILHLARARNQQLYATRNLEGFADAEASLRQLIEHGYYGGFPYYLLSIAHRLAAEIYQGSQGTRDESLVASHYSAALEWARRGQACAPDDDRTVTAEAECLESMDRWGEAIAARTRALELADTPRGRCEQYHYRWRLYYWTGDCAAAWDDVRTHAECVPDNRMYAHVYPALLAAEMGDWETALRHARALADDDATSALAVLWSATTLRLLGRAEEAAALLVERAETVDFARDLEPPQTAAWLGALYVHALSGGPRAELDALAAQVEQPWKLWGEAAFHEGARRLAVGDRAGALAAFQRAQRAFDGEERYTYHARVLLGRMRENATWPAWVPLSSEQEVSREPSPDAEPRVTPAGLGE